MTARNYTLKAMFFMAVGLAMALSGCNKDESFPAPVSGFEVITPIPEIGLPVKFGNLSTNAATYSWDFGDGTDSTNTGIAPEHTYMNPGSYTVSLTSTTADNQTSTETKEISIGQRHFLELDNLTFPETDADGKPWNADGSPPNVVFLFGPATEINDFLNNNRDDLPSSFISPVIDSIGVDPNKPPLFIPAQDDKDVVLTNEDFVFVILQITGTGDDTQIGVLDGIQFNPITGLPFTILSEADKTSYFSAGFRGFTFDFYYKVQWL